MTTTLYTSPPPRLVLAALRVFALKGFLAAGGGCVALRHALSAGGAPTLAALAGGGLPRDFALAAGLFIFSGCAAAYSTSAASRVVLSLTASPAAAAALRPAPALAGGPAAAAAAAARARAVVRVTTCSLLGRGRSFEAPAGDIEGASARATTQGFHVCARGASRLRSRRFFLFPVEPHWRSEDLPALRSLLFAAHFRDAEARGVEEGTAPRVSAPALAAGIAGFGPFRPAAFADPAGEGRAALLLPPPSDGGGGGGGDGAPANLPQGTRWEAGEVWADFVVPPPAPLAALRERELRDKAGVALAGAAEVEAALPSVPKIGVAPHALLK
jgi:hypothetical protein